MKIRKVALAYCLLLGAVGSSATALAVVPDCRVKVVWVMKQVKNRVSKATLERWKAWGIKHPAYRPPTTSRRPLYKSVWVRAAVDQFTCFPEESLDLWADTTNADTEVAQLDLLPELLMPFSSGQYPPSTPGASATLPSTGSTITNGQQDAGAGGYYLVGSGGGFGGGYYPPVRTTGSPDSPVATPTAPPNGVVSGTTIGTPTAPALTPEPSSLLLLATGLFGMALLVARYGKDSTENLPLEILDWRSR